MSNFNISKLPIGDIRKIELGRQAALLINKFRRGEITRGDILKHINELEEAEQGLFKEFLNKYRAAM